MKRRNFLGLGAGAAMAAAAPLPFQRGVNFTAESPGGYASPEARRMLDRLPAFGINSIAFVPYGFMRGGQANVAFRPSGTMEPDDAIAELAAIAHGKGIKVFLKPQVWISRSSPSDVDFTKPEDRKTFFDTYRAYMEHYASLAARIRADLFSVGVEFARMSRHEAEWRGLIARARRIYRGPLTYSANWGVEFESVKFWDAVDYIGLNNYYPLPDTLDAAGIAAKVEAVHRKFAKPVIFPEAGYSSLIAPHKQPWDESPRKLSMDDQVRCYEALFKAFYRKPWFHGVYWWKVGTNGFGGPRDGSHTPWDKPAMKTMAQWYLKGGR